MSFLRDDTRRRTCLMRLLTSEERPEERTGFRFPELEKHVREHRAELFGAALTVLRGWLRAGVEAPSLEGWGGPWGSFDDWDRVVRGAVVYAGLVDPIGAKATARESEATSGGLAEVVGGLEAALGELGEREATAGQLCEVIEGDEDWTHLSRLSRRRHARLLQGIAALAPQLRERLPSGPQLGRVLGKVKDRPVRVGTELKRVVARTLRGERLWSVESVSRARESWAVDDELERAEREAIEQEPRWN